MILQREPDKKLYSIHDWKTGKFIRRHKFTNALAVYGYLDRMYKKGKRYMAFELNTSKKKLPKAKLRVLENFIKKNKDELSPNDLKSFRRLYRILKNEPIGNAEITIENEFDTVLRELIPNSVWKAMGGEINKK